MPLLLPFLCPLNFCGARDSGRICSWGLLLSSPAPREASTGFESRQGGSTLDRRKSQARLLEGLASVAKATCRLFPWRNFKIGHTFLFMGGWESCQEWWWDLQRIQNERSNSVKAQISFIEICTKGQLSHLLGCSHGPPVCTAWETEVVVQGMKGPVWLWFLAGSLYGYKCLSVTWVPPSFLHSRCRCLLVAFLAVLKQGPPQASLSSIIGFLGLWIQVWLSDLPFTNQEVQSG